MNKQFDLASKYRESHADFPGYQKRPVIGLTGNYRDGDCTLAPGYWKSVALAGGIPVILPPLSDPQALGNSLDHIDGLLLTGGGDINPLYVDEEPLRQLHDITPYRDEAEMLVARMAVDRHMPVLGICRGIQILNLAMGGKIYQDFLTQGGGDYILHSQHLPREYASHTVCVAEGSTLEKVMKTNELKVNSFHHQSVSEPAPGMRICGTSPDGIIEAIESDCGLPLMGVQWHPECFILANDDSMMPIFRHFIQQADYYADACRIHSRTITLDSHCDTPMLFDEGVNFASRDEKALVDLHKMHEGRMDAVIMAAYLKQEGLDSESHSRAEAKTSRILSQIEEMVKQNNDYVELAYTPADLVRLKHQGKKAVMMGVENGYGIGEDIENINRLKKRGIVYITLCHNGNNLICGSARYNDEQLGLTSFGRQVVSRMNEVGIMVDISHAGERTFYEVLDHSTSPIVASHSSSRAICNHPRNLTDHQLRSLASAGGVAQVTFYHGFLRQEGRATVYDALRHLNHMVEVAGIDHVGIGSDFDGDGGVPGLESESAMTNFTALLLKEGYTEDDLMKIWGGNFLRVMNQVQNKK